MQPGAATPVDAALRLDSQVMLVDDRVLRVGSDAAILSYGAHLGEALAATD